MSILDTTVLTHEPIKAMTNLFVLLLGFVTFGMLMKSEGLMCQSCGVDTKCPQGSIGSLDPCPSNGSSTCTYTVNGTVVTEKRSYSCSIVANMSTLLSKAASGDNKGEIYRGCQDCNLTDWNFPGATTCPYFTKLYTGMHACICSEDACNNITVNLEVASNHPINVASTTISRFSIILILLTWSVLMNKN